MLAERFAGNVRDDANMGVAFLAKVVSLPASIIFPLMPDPASAIAVLACGLFCLSWLVGPMNAALQIITPNQMRGQISALFLSPAPTSTKNYHPLSKMERSNEKKRDNAMATIVFRLDAFD
jgi:hypothetical protein